MFKKCKYCGFKNPVDVGDCLFCHRDLPMTVGEFKEGIERLEDLAEGKVGKVGQEGAKDYVGEVVSSVKYRFHPVWWLKVKLHRLKMTLINIFWFFAIIGGIVIIGLVYNFLRKLLGR